MGRLDLSKYNLRCSKCRLHHLPVDLSEEQDISSFGAKWNSMPKRLQTSKVNHARAISYSIVKFGMY